jgi:hypothetical protein
MQIVARNTDNNSFFLVSLLLFANFNCFNFFNPRLFLTVLCYIVFELVMYDWFTLIGSYFWLVRFNWIIPHCAAKAFYSCPASFSQRPELRIISKEPQENTEEESKII